MPDKLHQHRTQNSEMFSSSKGKGSQRWDKLHHQHEEYTTKNDVDSYAYQQNNTDDNNTKLFKPLPMELPEEYMQLLDPLNSIWLYIIQPKVDDYGLVITDFFHPNTTHEISSDKRNLLLKGSFKRKIQLALKKSHSSSSPTTRKIHLANLRSKKVATVEFENSALVNEAIISCPPGIPRCRVIKYGGKFEHPSYSITIPESENMELFTVENSPSNSNGSSTLDYNIFRPNNKLVGRVTSKSGLSFMLHISEGVPPLDKALLLGFVIAMDMLKQGKSHRKNNEYEYND